MSSRYREVARILQEWIVDGGVGSGERMPSIHAAMERFGSSKNTIVAAYAYLEAKGLIFSRERSGYFVAGSPRVQSGPSALLARLPTAILDERAQDVLQTVKTLGHSLLANLMSPVLHYDLLPTTVISQSMRRVSANKLRQCLEVDFGQGDLDARRALSQHYTHQGLEVAAEDVICTVGCGDAIATSIEILSKPGDVIALQSPTFYTAMRVVSSLGRRIIEVPSSPTAGLDVNAFEQLADQFKISACLLAANLSAPTGATMPEAQKKRLMQIARKHDLPIIEDDVFGMLSSKSARLRPLKAYDDTGLVLLCSSVSKTISSGLRMGWCLPGRYKEQFLNHHAARLPALPIFEQAVVADMLQNGTYQRHIARLRKILGANMDAAEQMVRDTFPKGSVFHKPKGGFLAWVELPAGVNGWQVYRAAASARVVLAPGALYVDTADADRFVRLAVGVPTEHIVRAAAALSPALSKESLQSFAA